MAFWKRAICDECGNTLSLRTIYEDGVLIGDPCPACGYWVSRYMPGQEPK